MNGVPINGIVKGLSAVYPKKWQDVETKSATYKAACIFAQVLTKRIQP